MSSNTSNNKSVKSKSEHVNHQLLHDALNQRVENIDELTKAKLTSARLNALTQPEMASRWWQKLVPSHLFGKSLLASSFSVLGVIALLSFNDDAELITTEQQLLMAMMNPVLSEDLEMLEELEFIAWLELQEIQDS